MTNRQMPPMLPDVRSLPNGEYLVRVAFMNERDMTASAGGSLEVVQSQNRWIRENVPNVVLYFGVRMFALDLAQSFQFGSVRQAEPPKLLHYYKLTVFEPGPQQPNRNARGGVDVRYEELGPTEPEGFGELRQPRG